MASDHLGPRLVDGYPDLDDPIGWLTIGAGVLVGLALWIASVRSDGRRQG